MPGCGGRLDISRIGGCIAITKVHYSCKDDYRKMLEQLKRVQDICEGKSNCRVPASRPMFGTIECAGLYFDMRMKIKYRCDGGQDKT